MTFTPDEAAGYIRLTTLLRAVEYRDGWRYQVSRIRTQDGRIEDRLELWACVTDSEDPGHGPRWTQVVHWRPVSLAATEEELFRLAFELACAAERHECAHFFRVRGVAVYNEHGAGGADVE